MSEVKEQPEKQSEREKLEAEKERLAKKLGIWGKYEPKDGHEQTDEFKRIQEIDKRLFEIA